MFPISHLPFFVDFGIFGFSSSNCPTWVQIRKILCYAGFEFMVKWNRIRVFWRKFCVFFQIYGKTTWNLWYLGSRDPHYLNPCCPNSYEIEKKSFTQEKGFLGDRGYLKTVNWQQADREFKFFFSKSPISWQFRTRIQLKHIASHLANSPIC